MNGHIVWPLIGCVFFCCLHRVTVVFKSRLFRALRDQVTVHDRTAGSVTVNWLTTIHQLSCQRGSQMFWHLTVWSKHMNLYLYAITVCVGFNGLGKDTVRRDEKRLRFGNRCLILEVSRYPQGMEGPACLSFMVNITPQAWQCKRARVSAALVLTKLSSAIPLLSRGSLTQWTRDAIITSFWRQNDVIIALCARWEEPRDSNVGILENKSTLLTISRLWRYCGPSNYRFNFLLYWYAPRVFFWGRQCAFVFPIYVRKYRK